MKLTKSQLQNMIKESVQSEIKSIATEQKSLSKYIDAHVKHIPFLNEYKNLKKKQDLLEFFGPFKKLKTADLAKMADKDKEEDQDGSKQQAKEVAKKVKQVDSARKQLTSAKLTDVSKVELALEAYVDNLIDLYESLEEADVSEDIKDLANRSFAVAAYTLQNLSSSISDAAAELFSNVPRSSGVYEKGAESQQTEKQKQKFMRSPAQTAGAAIKGAFKGAGGPPRRPHQA